MIADGFSRQWYVHRTNLQLKASYLKEKKWLVSLGQVPNASIQPQIASLWGYHISWIYYDTQGPQKVLL